MEKKFENIITGGKRKGKTVDEINAELKAAGATFHLDYTMTLDGPQTGWSEKEMAEGFIPNEGESADVSHLHDYMRYDVTKAGQTVRVETPEGTYDITWDEGGHPEKAVRV